MPVKLPKRQAFAEEHPKDPESSGWDAIQRQMLGHDEKLINGFTDNIDTLLVFAGLFSAVLTAFVIGSTASLQQDNSQISVELLARIVTTLESGRARPLPLNGTSLPPSPTFRFEAQVTSVAINCLWFTSLVLSLAAALYGILAKQWCREYLNWHSALLPARTNVLLRQMRCEAWEEWNVASHIASIPALLEVALVLFFFGLVIFVWTLHHILAAVVTATTVLVMITELFMTARPLFSRLSPYKSSTGWAAIRIAQIFYRLFASANSRQAVVESCSSWRDRDLSVALNPTLCRMTRVGIDITKDTYPIYAFEEPNANGVLLDAFQSSLLVRALAWFRRGSHDKMFVHITQAAHLLHDPSYAYDVARDVPFLHSSLYVMCQLNRASESYANIRQAVIRNWRIAPLAVKPSLDGALCSHPCIMASIHLVECNGTALAELLKSAFHKDQVAAGIAYEALFSDILRLIDHWVACQHDSLSSRIMIGLCALRCGMRHGQYNLTGWFHQGTQKWQNTLTAAFHTLARHERAYFNGLVPMILESLGELGKVTIDFPSDRVHVICPKTSISPYSVSHWADLAIQIYRSTEGYVISERRHLFIVSTCTVFNSLQESLTEHREWYRSWPDDAAALHELLCCMVESAELSLENRYLECGAQIKLPWISSWQRLLTATEELRIPQERILFIGEPRIRAKFLVLVALVESMSRARLIAGSHIIEDLVELRTRIATSNSSTAGAYDIPRHDTDQAYARALPSTPCAISAQPVATVQRENLVNARPATRSDKSRNTGVSQSL